jgi:hypothetical protein
MLSSVLISYGIHWESEFVGFSKCGPQMVLTAWQSAANFEFTNAAELNQFSARALKIRDSNSPRTFRRKVLGKFEID